MYKINYYTHSRIEFHYIYEIVEISPAAIPNVEIPLVISSSIKIKDDKSNLHTDYKNIYVGKNIKMDGGGNDTLDTVDMDGFNDMIDSHKIGSTLFISYKLSEMIKRNVDNTTLNNNGIYIYPTLIFAENKTDNAYTSIVNTLYKNRLGLSRFNNNINYIFYDMILIRPIKSIKVRTYLNNENYNEIDI